MISNVLWRKAANLSLTISCLVWNELAECMISKGGPESAQGQQRTFAHAEEMFFGPFCFRTCCARGRGLSAQAEQNGGNVRMHWPGLEPLYTIDFKRDFCAQSNLRKIETFEIKTDAKDH
jgi:hypothetical protein